jgi:hypothetical protein
MLNAKGWRQLSRGDPDPSAVGSNPRLNGRYLSAWHRRLVRALCIVLASSDALAAKSVPVCGPAAGVATATKPTASLCSVGTASSVGQRGSNWTWTCKAAGATVSCSAPLPPPPPPSLTLTVSPSMPVTAASSPKGTVVATVRATWSDGSQFTGTISFTAPNYDDGGTFALSGSNLIISPIGLGISGDGGTIQRVTLVAEQ